MNRHTIVAKDTLRSTPRAGDDDGGWRVAKSPPRVGLRARFRGEGLIRAVGVGAVCR